MPIRQEEELEPGRKLFIPKLRARSQPGWPIPPRLPKLAKLLVAAENPVIVSGRYTRTEAGPKRLVQLAELLQAPVVDERNRMNMPSRHPLNHSERGAAMIRQADVVLALEPMDLFGTLNNVDDLIGRPAQLEDPPGHSRLS